MKKIILSAIAIFTIGFANAQETKFGVKAGFNSSYATASGGGLSVSGTQSGFFVGGFAQLGISDKFSIQPEINYVSVGNDYGNVNIPILAKYEVAESFSILAGPSISFFTNVKDTSGLKTFNYGIDLAVAYDINENFFVDARYDIGLANLSKNSSGDYKLTYGGFFVGVGYKF